MKIILDVLAILALAFVLTELLCTRAKAKGAIDVEFKPLDEPTSPPCARRSHGWQDSPSREIASQLFVEGLPAELKRALRRNAEELEKVEKWRHYAEHAKKGRTRKKYRNKLREYHRSHPFPWYWLPSSMELTSGLGYSSGRGLDSGSHDVIWWRQNPGLLFPVGEGGRIADWGPRPL